MDEEIVLSIDDSDTLSCPDGTELEQLQKLGRSEPVVKVSAFPKRKRGRRRGRRLSMETDKKKKHRREEGGGRQGPKELKGRVLDRAKSIW